MLPTKSYLTLRLLMAIALYSALIVFPALAHAQAVIIVEPAHRDALNPPKPANFPKALPNGVLELVDNGESPFHADGEWDWLSSALSIDVNPATGQPAIAYFAYGAPPGRMQTAFFSLRNPDGSWSKPVKISYPPREPAKASVGIELDLMFDPSEYIEGVGESAVPYIAANVYNENPWAEYYANTGLNLYRGAWDRSLEYWAWTARSVIQTKTDIVWVWNDLPKEGEKNQTHPGGIHELGHWVLSEDNPYFIHTQPKLIVGNDPRMPEGQRQVQAVYYQSNRLLRPFMKYDPYASGWVEDSGSEKRIISLAEATFTSQRGPFTVDVESGFSGGFGAYDFRPLGGNAGYRNAALYIESSYGRETLYYKAEQEGSRAWNYPRDEVASLSGFNQRFGSICLDCFGDKVGMLWTVHPERDYTSDVYFLENVGEAWRPTPPQPVVSGVSYIALVGYTGENGTPIVLYREADEPYRLFIKYRHGDGVWSEPILADEENPERMTGSFDMAIRGDRIFIASGKDGDLYCTTLDFPAIANGE